MRSTRIAAAVAGAVILVGGLSACNNDEGGKASGGGSSSTGGSDAGGKQDPAQNPADALKAAQQATKAKKTAKIDGSTTATLLGKQVKQSTKGDLDWSQGMRMNVENTTDVAGSSGKPLKPVKAIYAEDAVYMNMGGALPGGGGKPWTKYPYSFLSKKLGGTGTLLQEALQKADPSQAIELLAASGSAKAVGTEDVGGVQATHYTGTLELDQLSDKLGKDLRDMMRKQLAKGGAKSEQLDVWIDSHDLLVKKREKLGGKQPSDSTVFYTGYGTKVDVAPPPADQTTTAPGA
ncbi:hypothetical protein SAMN05428945_2234 [Streptomyces sp. 2224.1]|uniref:hypothetical protein n=1 Tax=Streptomyces sp. 2224.1 TaxID=1881020 RepID=UPI000895DA67|nr:hypothetical protein [Streptomyces sp. 2224.1]SEC17573.1 hypothetical protein SAMN05428945_2234 [Streptomyces sp. 2224.1]